VVELKMNNDIIIFEKTNVSKNDREDNVIYPTIFIYLRGVIQECQKKS